MTAVRAFKVVACIEAVSYLVLVTAAVTKRVVEAPDLVPIFGPVHGVIFLVYLALALVVRRPLRWSPTTTVTAIVAAAIPFGGFYVEQRLARIPASRPSSN